MILGLRQKVYCFKAWEINLYNSCLSSSECEMYYKPFWFCGRHLPILWEAATRAVCCTCLWKSSRRWRRTWDLWLWPEGTDRQNLVTAWGASQQGSSLAEQHTLQEYVSMTLPRLGDMRSSTTGGIFTTPEMSICCWHHCDTLIVIFKLIMFNSVTISSVGSNSVKFSLWGV